MIGPSNSICILGTSLISACYIKIVRDYLDVYVFESDLIGGAWRAGPIGSCPEAPLFNNIICPLSLDEQESIPDIYSFLEETTSSNISSFCTSLNLAIDYSPSSYLLGNFSPFIQDCLNHPNVHIISEPIRSLYVNYEEIIVNKSFAFPFMLLPENFNIYSFTLDDLCVKPSYEHHTSLHFRARVKSLPPVAPRYSENFDNIFDRGGFNSFQGSSIFIGRIRREYKHLDVYSILRHSSFLSDRSKVCILDHEINSYNHIYASNYLQLKEQIQSVSPRLILYPSRQFVHSFQHLPSILYRLSCLYDAFPLLDSYL